MLFKYVKAQKGETKFMDVHSFTDHLIICGYGKISNVIIEELANEKESFVVIENDMKIFKALEEKKIPCVFGNSFDEEVLTEAGINTAKSLIITFLNDSENLYTVLAAKELNPSLNVVSRASSSNSAKTIKGVGANKVLVIADLLGSHILSCLFKPIVANFLEQINYSDESAVLVEEVVINCDSNLINMNIGCLRNDENSNAIVLALRRSSTNELIFNPNNDTKIRENDIIIAIGTEEQIEILKSLII